MSTGIAASARAAWLCPPGKKNSAPAAELHPKSLRRSTTKLRRWVMSPASRKTFMVIKRCDAVRDYRRALGACDERQSAIADVASRPASPIEYPFPY